MSKLSETLEDMIAESNLDNKQFALAVGINAGCITGYIRHGKLPTVENLIKIADYFQRSTDFLLGREEESVGLSFKPCPPFCERIEFLLHYFQCSSYYIYSNAGITKSRYYEWKNGKRKPSLESVIRLADIFDCRVDFILGRES